MGGSSSAPRSLTLEQEASGVVKVSEAVARRLVGKPEPQPIEQKKEPVNIVHPEDRSEEIQKLQNRYEKRIRSLEKQNKELHKTTTEQFAQAVEEVEKKFLKTTAAPICDDLQNEVMKCYQDNAKETLNCSQIVRSYTACVQQQRQSVLTKKECQPCLLAQMARGPCGVAFMKAYDCYLDDGNGDDKEHCAQLYLEMKDCWDQHPEYGYQKIIDRAYSDTPSKTKQEAEMIKNNDKPKVSDQKDITSSNDRVSKEDNVRQMS